MAFGDLGTFAVSLLFVFLVVTVVGVDEVVEFADFGCEVGGAGFEVVEVGACTRERVLAEC